MFVCINVRGFCTCCYDLFSEVSGITTGEVDSASVVPYMRQVQGLKLQLQSDLCSVIQ